MQTNNEKCGKPPLKYLIFAQNRVNYYIISAIIAQLSKQFFIFARGFKRQKLLCKRILFGNLKFNNQNTITHEIIF